jgi:hypothetical protein
MNGTRRTILMLGVTLILLMLSIVPGRSARAAACPNLQAIDVPGAERQELACLDDLTTAGLVASGHTNPADWAGLHAAGTINPSGVPGIQVDGYFPDSSTSNTNHGWNHDAQFVIRLPNNWNGKLVITGAPGVRRQYANDFIIGDWVLARGYAFASTDKGHTGAAFFKDGAAPGDAVAEWHARVRELTVAAKRVVHQRYGRNPHFTYMTGISNGGYLTRYALENNQELYDGGVDWEGTLFTAAGPNLFTYLPAALKYYPAYAATGSQTAHDALIAAGFAPGSEFLWPLHYQIYWDLTQRIYREEFDPAWDGALEAGIPFCATGTPLCDADYDYGSRPQFVKDAVANVSLTGKIKRPMLTLHGTFDTLLPITTDSDVYAHMIDAAHRAPLHRYYTIEAGNHVDSFYGLFPAQLRPMLPCYRSAFLALERWVEHNAAPPDSRFVAKPASGDLLNTCAL